MSNRVSKLLGNMQASLGIRPEAPETKTITGPATPAVEGRMDPRDGYSRNRQAGDMEIGRIVPDPDQPRKEFDPEALERLAASIKARGLLQPIRVRWNSELGKHVVVCGERRYRASVMAGLQTIPCMFVEGALSEAELLEDQLAENVCRDDLKPIERAAAFRRYMDVTGCSAADLAGMLKVAASTVTRDLSLLQLPEKLQHKVDAGELPVRAAQEIARVEDPVVQEELAAKVDTGMTTEEVQAVVRRERAARKPKEEPKAAKVAKAPAKGPVEETFRVKAPAGKVTVALRRGGDAEIREALLAALAVVEGRMNAAPMESQAA
ncbi:MAG: ParB/RepB/Spo0J family partition protein [Planctomycetia bacterium]